MSEKTPAKRLVRASVENGVVTLSVKDEADLSKVIGTATLDIASIPALILPHLIAQGIMTVAQGAYSHEEGSAAKLTAIEAVAKEIMDGTYTPGRKGGTEQTPSILLAILEVLTAEGKSLTIEQVEEKYDAMSKVDKTKLARRPKIMIARAKIDKEREAKRLASAKARSKEETSGLEGW